MSLPSGSGFALRAPRPALRRAFLAGLALLIALTAGGCAARKSAPAPDPAARAQALIDAGNQAFRAGDYRQAAQRYGAAVVVRNDDPAAYYGLGMALSKLGRDEDARAAYARARDLAQKR